MTAEPVVKEIEEQPNALWSLGCLMILRESSPDIEVIEALARPGVSPPLHRHDFGTESFYILEGRARFYLDGTEITAAPGDLVHVPRSTPHTFEVIDGRPSRMLDIIAPAGLWEFFAECGEPATDMGMPDGIVVPPNLGEIVSRHGGAVLGPPLRLLRG
jgi:quercetin dioxygenase-like cupin family protein